MAKYHKATLVPGGLQISPTADLEKPQAIIRLKKQGSDNSVYTTKSKAHTLATALSDGKKGTWRDDAHVPGGYKHYHDITHQYPGHIFYGEPSPQ